jgi:Zn-dependent peptidase ImmA (M78 family)
MGYTENGQRIVDGLHAKTGASEPLTAVRRILTHLLTATEQSVPPIRVKPMLNVLDVEFKYDERGLGDAEAAVRTENGRLYLQIAQGQIRGSKRWRFSIAHEFIHIVLIKTLGPQVVSLAHADKATYDFVEWLCDAAASHLLVPSDHLLDRLREKGLSRSTLQATAKDCDVSFEVILRATNGLLPGGAIFLMSRFRRGKKDQLKLRVRQCSTSNKETPERPWIPFGCGPKHLGSSDECLERALKTQEPIELEVQKGGYTWMLDGIILPWPHTVHGTLLPDDKERTVGRSVPHDDGAIAVVCAKRGFLDPSLFKTRFCT